jgi:glycosyltransferase involved in cell wall biosynthesis
MDRHCKACAEQINDGAFDLLFVAPCAFFRTSPIGRHVGIPSCLYLQEPNRPLYEAQPRLPWLAPEPPAGRLTLRYAKDYVRDLLATQARRLQVRAELEWAGSFKSILVNSFFSRESVLRAYNLESAVCYLGIDTDHFRPTGAAKEPFAIGVGNFAENKGIERAVAAVASIEEARRPTLVWVGNRAVPDYLAHIESLAQSLGVNFVSRVLISDGELIDLLSRAAVMVYTPRLEPFGYAPLEANACGTAVVAIPEGGVRETVVTGSNGVLVEDVAPALLGKAVLNFTSNLENAHAVGQAARKYVEAKWGFEASIDRLERRLYALVPAPRGCG